MTGFIVVLVLFTIQLIIYEAYDLKSIIILTISLNKTKWIWVYDREKRRHTRPYKAIQGHTKSNNASHIMAVKSNKTIRGHIRPYKTTQGKHDNSIPYCATEARFLFPCTFLFPYTYLFPCTFFVLMHIFCSLDPCTIFVWFGTFLEFHFLPTATTRTTRTKLLLVGPLSVARGQKAQLLVNWP